MPQENSVSEQARDLLFPQDEKTEEITNEEESNEVDGAANDEEEVVAEGTEIDEENEGEESKSEAPEIANIHDLSEAIGWDDNQIYDIIVPMSAGAEPVTVGQLKDLHESNILQSAELKKKIENQNADENTSKETYQALMQSPLELMNIRGRIQGLEERYNNVDWSKLREENPSEYAALNMEFNQTHQQLNVQANQIDQQFHQEQEQQFQNIKAQNANLLYQNIPEWQDTDVFSKDSETISNMLSEYGYQQNEIENIIDWRALKIAKDLIDLKQGKSIAKESIKKVRKAPKMLKGGMAKIRTKEQDRKLKTDAMMKKAKSGSREDKQNAVRALLYGS